jgi:transposase-like protein
MTTIDFSSASSHPSRRRFRAPARQRLVDEFLNSEQSAAQFCDERGLCRSSLWRWIARQREEQQGGALVRIPTSALSQTTMPTTACTDSVSAELSNGTRLSIPAGIDPVWIGALVRELSGGT